MKTADRPVLRAFVQTAILAGIVWSLWALPLPYQAIVPVGILVGAGTIWFIGICLSPEPSRPDWLSIGRERH